MEFTILEILYASLTVFVIVIGILLSIVLVKVIRILKVADDFSQTYFKVKRNIAYFTSFSNVRKKAFNLFKR